MKASSRRVLNLFRFYMFLGGVWFATVITLGMWDDLPENTDELWLLLFFILFMVAVFSSISNQKTVYCYKLSSVRGVCESYLYYPSWTDWGFKVIAVFAGGVFLVAAVFTGSLMPLFGVGALGVGYMGRLVVWKNETDYELSKPWDQHGFVTLDYKRKIIVTHFSEILYGFELRFPNDVLFNECLVFLRGVMPFEVEFLERKWDSEDARRLNI